MFLGLCCVVLHCQYQWHVVACDMRLARALHCQVRGGSSQHSHPTFLSMHAATQSNAGHRWITHSRAGGPGDQWPGWVAVQLVQQYIVAGSGSTSST
jgi:hypothetical protein